MQTEDERANVCKIRKRQGARTSSIPLTFRTTISVSPSRRATVRRRKLPRGHSDIFFPPTCDSGALNHPEFPGAGYPPVPGNGEARRKGKKVREREETASEGKRVPMPPRRSERAAFARIGEDTCHVRAPDTQRPLNYDRAKLVSIKVINFEFNNRPG